MADNTQDQNYIDRDARIAQQFAPVISPLTAQGVDPDEAYMNRALMARAATDLASRGMPGAAPTSTTPVASPSASVPATVTPSGKPSTWQDIARKSAQSQLSAADAASSALASVPAEDDKSAAIQARIDQENKPIQARDAQGKLLQQYRPSLGQKIKRGLAGAGMGLLRGGIVGSVAGAVNPHIAGERGYDDPNNAYEQAENARQQSLAADTQSLNTSRKAFEDATNRAKSISQEQRGVAGAYKDAGATATTAMEREETARHNQAEEDIKRNPTNDVKTEFQSIHTEAQRRFPNQPFQAYEWERKQLIDLKNAERAPKDTSATDLAKAIQATEFGMRMSSQIDQQKEAERNRRYAELGKDISLKYDEQKMSAAKQKIDSELDTKYGPKYQQAQDKVDRMLGITKTGGPLQSKNLPKRVKVGDDLGPAPAGRREGQTGTLPDGTKVVIKNGRAVVLKLKG
jgi:hypothetical protein